MEGNLTDLKKKKLFLFDLDGVFYKGKESRIKLGGTKLINKLRSQGRKFFILTNNSTDTVRTISSNLQEFDIPVRTQEVLSSGLLTGEFVSKKYGRISYFLVGEPGLEKELGGFGLRRTNSAKASVVVVGLDRRLTYHKLDRASKAGWNGADIVATHSARVYMYKDGPAIATGPTVKALEYATGKKATVIGKPSPLMFELALQRAKVQASDAVMVGDQVETDILGARRAGMDSILVLTGVEKGQGKIRAQKVVRNIDDLADLL
jgi:4-nitrophenyl phosphatase